METPAMDEFLVSIFHLKYVIDDIGGNNDEHRLYVFHTPGKKFITLLFTEIEFYINLVKSKNAKIGNGNYFTVLFIYLQRTNLKKFREIKNC